MEAERIIENLKLRNNDVALRAAAENLTAAPTTENWYIMGLVKLCTNDWDYASMCFQNCGESREARIGMIAVVASQEGAVRTIQYVMALLLGLPIKFEE